MAVERARYEREIIEILKKADSNNQLGIQVDLKKGAPVVENVQQPRDGFVRRVRRGLGIFFGALLADKPLPNINREERRRELAALCEARKVATSTGPQQLTDEQATKARWEFFRKRLGLRKRRS